MLFITVRHGNWLFRLNSTHTAVILEQYSSWLYGHKGVSFKQNTVTDWHAFKVPLMIPYFTMMASQLVAEN